MIQASPVSSPTDPARLWAIARKVLAPERTYAAEHVQAKLEIYLGITPERARQGFNLMLAHGVLSSTFGDPRKYFLSDSTPF